MATNTGASGWLRGKVKAVTSGDCLLIMGSTKAEIPPEKSITLSYLMAPRLACRGGVDEPFAWESREFLRKLCVGKEVTFRVDYTAPNVGQEFSTVYLGDKNIAYSVVAAGWARVKEQGPKGGEQSPYLAELQRLEEVAKQQGLGHWSKEPGAAKESIRDLPPSAIGESSGFDAKGFAVENKGKSLEAIVEQVRDGSTVRVYLLPSFQFVQIYVAGVQAPSMGRRPPNSTIVAETEGTTDCTVNGEDSGETPAPLTTAQRLAASAVSTEIAPDRFAREAKHFTEIRVLNRDVRIVVEGTDSFNNIIGSVYYPDGETAKELALELVENGLAKYVEWSASMLDVETKIKLKNAELQAKKEQLRIWTGFKPPVINSKPILDQKFTGKVVDVVSGDCIIVADDAAPYGSPSAERRVNLSSIRAPKIGNPRREDNKPANFARESKEFLRTRLIGKQVTVEMEYSRRISTMDGQNAVPATNMADTRVLDYGSVFLGSPSQADGDDISSVPSSGNQPGVNVAELLLSWGFAQTSKHRDYEERSHYFDALLAAEARALKAKKGVHSSKDSPVMHITDLTMVSSNSPGLSFPTHTRRSPVAPTMSDFRPPEHQVAGHRAAANKLGPLVDGAGLFFKPLQALDRGEHELAFYTAFSAHPAVPPRIRDTFFPRFHGTRLLPNPASPGESHLHLVLDDLLEGLASPSVIDIKIGACTWPPRAPEPYIAKCLAKDRASTSVLLGFRVSGVRVADARGAVWRPERSELKEMDIPGVRRVLRRYVSSVGGEGPDFAFAAAVYGGEGGVLAQLRELKAWFEGQTLFHFYSASVLLSYDANAVSVAGGGGAVRVKLVDFAHVVESEGVIDHNFLGGLCSLIKFITDIVAEASETAPSGHS